MIRVILTGPPSGTGFMPYKVNMYTYGKPHLVGVSKQPLLDACRQLKQIGLMDDTVVGLFDEADPQWKFRTTVGYGAKAMGPYREFPGGPIKETPELELDHGAWRMRTSDATPATPAAEPPTPRTPPTRPAEHSPGHAERAKPEKPHHRPRPKGSGARRGSRSRG